MPEVEEKRIYVVVAEKVTSTSPRLHWNSLEVVQPAGRLAAQVGHVVSKVRVMEIASDPQRAPYFQPHTTIVLSARNSAELAHVAHVLTIAKVDFETFTDTNTAYGCGPVVGGQDKGLSVMTAVATYPVEPSNVEGLLDHLPLWRPNCG